MTQKRLKLVALLAALATVLSLAGCNKKVAKVTPPTPPPPVAPTATLAANPNVIQQGQSTTLTWQTSNATEIAIAGLGTLPSSGSRSVTAWCIHHLHTGREGTGRNEGRHPPVSP